MRLIGASLFLLATTTAYAQEKQLPEVRALNMRVGAEINANLQCSTVAITLQDQLQVAQNEIKRLIEKYETKEK